MKSLNKYILEKLIINQQVDEKLLINKNLKKYNYDMPNKEGLCLAVAYPDIKLLSCNIPRIALSTFEYKYNGDKVLLPFVSYIFDRTTEEGVFYYNDKTWLYLLFFNDTAKQILDDAIDNNDMKFDFNDYAPSLNKEFNIKEIYRIGTYNNDVRIPYDKKHLQQMKNSIK